MSSEYPVALMENLQPVRRHANRGAYDGSSLVLMHDAEFQRQAFGMPEIDITRALFQALHEPNGKKFDTCDPSFTLTRSPAVYPRLFSVVSQLNRGAIASPSLASEAARCLTTGLDRGVPTSDPTFLRIIDRSNLERTAFLAGFTAEGLDIVPLILLGGKLHRPPAQGSYPRIPFSKMARFSRRVLARSHQS